MKWKEWGFKPLLCTCRLNRTRRTSWGWWDERDDTALQTQNSSRARYLSVTEAPHNIECSLVSGDETVCFFETWILERGTNLRSPTFQAGSFNHCTRALTLHEEEWHGFETRGCHYAKNRYAFRVVYVQIKAYMIFLTWSQWLQGNLSQIHLKGTGPG